MASTRITLKHDMSKLEQLFRGLGKKELQKAVARSIKRTLVTVKAHGAREIRSRKFIKITAAEAKERVKGFDHSNPSRGISKQYGKIWIGSKAESLGRFHAKRIVSGKSKAIMKQDKYGAWKGVNQYKVTVNQYGRKALNQQKAFLGLKGKSPVVFEREGNGRLPIKKIFGPSMAEMVRNTNLMQQLRKVAETRYTAEMRVNMKYFAAQAVARAQKKKR